MGERGSRPEIDIRDIPEELIIEDDRPVSKQEVPITPSTFQRIIAEQNKRQRRKKNEGPPN